VRYLTGVVLLIVTMIAYLLFMIKMIEFELLAGFCLYTITIAVLDVAVVQENKK